MQLHYENFNYQENTQEKAVFFKWALDNELFSAEHQNSRMKKVYLGERKVKDVFVVIVFDDKNPIAIGMCEKMNMVISLDETLDKNSNNPKIAVAGFLSLYVKTEYRKNGIAKDLIHRIESERIKQIKNEISDISGDIYGGFMAGEKAVPLIMKFSKHSYPMDFKEDFDEIISMINKSILTNASDKMVESNVVKKHPIIKMSKTKVIKPKL